MADNLQSCRKSVSLHCVFHSIRFKVNKGWSKALLLFYVYMLDFLKKNGIFVKSQLLSET